MALKDFEEPEPGLSLSEILRPVLSVLAPATALILLFLSGAGGSWSTDLGWRDGGGLLIVSCTLAIIVLQVFFNQYFELQLRKKVLLSKLREDQADDRRLLEALSRLTGEPVSVSTESSNGSMEPR